MRDGTLIEFAGNPSVYDPFLIFQGLSQVLHLDRRLCKNLVQPPCASSSKQVQLCLHNHILFLVEICATLYLMCGRLIFTFPSSCEHAQNSVLECGVSVLPVMDELFPEEIILQVHVSSLLA